jgi:molecular chaperone DnaK
MAENMIFQTKKQMEELKDKITPDQKSRLEAEITRLVDAVKTDNADTIKSALDQFQKAWGEISQTLYQQQGAPNPDMGGNPEGDAQASGGQQEKEKNVEDAEFKEV